MKRQTKITILLVIGFIVIGVVAFLIYDKTNTPQQYATITTTSNSNSNQGILGTLASLFPFF